MFEVNIWFIPSIGKFTFGFQTPELVDKTGTFWLETLLTIGSWAVFILSFPARISAIIWQSVSSSSAFTGSLFLRENRTRSSRFFYYLRTLIKEISIPHLSPLKSVSTDGVFLSSKSIKLVRFCKSWLSIGTPSGGTFSWMIASFSTIMLIQTLRQDHDNTEFCKRKSNLQVFCLKTLKSRGASLNPEGSTGATVAAGNIRSPKMWWLVVTGKPCGVMRIGLVDPIIEWIAIRCPAKVVKNILPIRFRYQYEREQIVQNIPVGGAEPGTDGRITVGDIPGSVVIAVLPGGAWSSSKEFNLLWTW